MPTRKTAPREYGSRQFILDGLLAPGTVIGSGLTVRELVAIEDFIRCRFRCQLSANDGTFEFEFVHPDLGLDDLYIDDGTAVHLDKAAADLAISTTTEVVTDNIDLYGEAFILVSYTDAGGGSTIGHVAFCGAA